jgi:hypothetical protein
VDGGSTGGDFGVGEFRRRSSLPLTGPKHVAFRDEIDFVVAIHFAGQVCSDVGDAAAGCRYLAGNGLLGLARDRPMKIGAARDWR